VEAAAEGEVVSRREAPRHIQVDHPPSIINNDINERTTRSRSRNASRIIGDMNERTTRSRVRNNSHFAQAAFVATFEPKDIGHTLSDHN
jgi:hypothetical protein